MASLKNFNISNITCYLLLFIFAALFIFPVYWLLISSVKTALEFSRIPPGFFPQNFDFSHYPVVWRRLDFGGAFRNSIYVTALTTGLILLFCGMGGYVLAKKHLPGKKAIMLVIIATMVVPPTVLLVPLFYVISAAGLYDSLWGLILPFSVTSFGLFFMKQYMRDLPNELLEAARMDSCGEYSVFFVIVLPLIKPGLATLATIELVNNWNSFTMPLVLIKTPALQTIPLKISALITATDVVEWSLILAGNVLAVVPVLLIFVSLQNYFIKGVMDGAVKG